jgi:hypothetical protein
VDDITQSFNPDDAGVSEERTAGILGVTLGTLATWRSKGRGPKYRKVGRRVEYTPRFIREFQETCIRTPEPAKVRRHRGALIEEATSGRAAQHSR